MAMGWTHPVGLLSGRPSLSVRSGIGGRRPASMSLRNPKQMLADGRRVASRMCSWVQPVSPGAAGEHHSEGVMQRGGTCVVGAKAGSSCGWRAATCCMTFGVMVGRGIQHAELF
jgi:hypothetical protein